jgi:hypothetical protein
MHSCLLEVPVSAYIYDGTMLFSDRNIVSATTIWAADIGMSPLL